MNRSFPFKWNFHSKITGLNIFQFMGLELVSNYSDRWFLRESIAKDGSFSLEFYKDKMFGFDSECIYSLNDDYSVLRTEYKSEKTLLYLSASEAILLLELRRKEIKALDENFNVIDSTKASGLYVENVVYFQGGFYEFKENNLIKSKGGETKIIDYPEEFGFYSLSDFCFNKIYLELYSGNGYCVFEFKVEDDSFLEVFSCKERLSYIGGSKERMIFLSGNNLYIKDYGELIYSIQVSGDEIFEFDDCILVYSSESNVLQIIDEQLNKTEYTVGGGLQVRGVSDFGSFFVLSLTRFEDDKIKNISPLYDFKFKSLSELENIIDIKIKDFCCSQYFEVINDECENGFDVVIKIPYMDLFGAINETLGVTLEIYQEYCVRSNLIDYISEPRNSNCSSFSGVFLYDISDEYDGEERSSVMKVIEILFARYVFRSGSVSSCNENLLKFDFVGN